MKMNNWLILIGLLIVSSFARAEIITTEVDYWEGDTLMKGMVAYDSALQGKRPGVLIVHEWWGHNEHARDRAKMLAQEGYVAFAVDMYGNRQTADHPKDAGKFASAVGGNLSLARARFEAAMDALKEHPNVDADKLAAMGYCFGGGIVLKMARAGVDLRGVSSFHGSLATDQPAKKGEVKASVRVFNGADDPFVKPEHIEALKAEMKNAGVDFEFVNYANVLHSFTNPGANALGRKFGLPVEYNTVADRDSWQRNLAFFREIFSD